ncbi:MAG: hypothetical protein CFE33_20825, partial [Pseudorhodobacter sp. PARRP1]
FDATATTSGLYIGAGAGDDSIFMGSGNDTVYGGTGADTIRGGAGNDVLFGDAGNDTLDGGAGNDGLDGGAGDDKFLLNGTFGNDTITGGETGETTGDVLNSAGVSVSVSLTFSGSEAGSITDGSSTTSFSQIEAVALGAGNDKVIGGAGNESVDGGAGNDSMAGGAGNDSLSGGANNDTLDGGAGNDGLDGGAGDDRFLLSDTFGNDTITGGETGETTGDVLNSAGVTTNVTLTFSGSEAGSITDGSSTTSFSQIEAVALGAGNDTVIGGAGNDSVDGGAGNDSMTGGAGNDSLSGGANNDTLDGGAGNDDLTGGAGDDRFVFETASGHDVIHDFDMSYVDNGGVTADRLDVSDLDNGQGRPVTAFDVSITDDGLGNAVLHFPGGELITIIGLSPADAALPGTLTSMGIPCFARGTLILTTDGERRIEEIAVGDLVVTAQGGSQPVLWHGTRHLTAADLNDQPHLRPVRVQAGRFGAVRDLTLSPQHAVSVAGALIRAKHLAEWGQGVRVAQGMRGVTYHHLLLPHHALIRSEGAWTESFYPGRIALAGLTASDRLTLAHAILRQQGFAINFTSGTLCEAYGPRCQPLLSGREAKASLRRSAPPVPA